MHKAETGRMLFWQFKEDAFRGQSFTQEGLKGQKGSVQEAEGEERREERWRGAEHSCVPTPPLLRHSLPWGISLSSVFPPLACELLKDQDHALFWYPQVPVQVEEKGLRGAAGRNLRSTCYVLSTARGSRVTQATEFAPKEAWTPSS